MKFDIELEGASEGWVYFSIKDHPEYGDIVLPGELLNAMGMLFSATIEFTDIDENLNLDKFDLD